MKKVLTVVVAVCIIGLVAVLVLNRSDPAAGAAPAIAGALASMS